MSGRESGTADGTPTAGRQASQVPDADSTAEDGSRSTIRVVAVYGTSWLLPNGTELTPVTDHLALTERAAASAVAAQLPAVLARTSHEPSSLGTPQGKSGTRSLGVSTWLFALPSGRLVATLALDVVTSAEELRPLLADLIEGRAEIGGEPLDTVFAAAAGASGQLAPERHVLAFFGDGTSPAPADEAVSRLLFPAVRTEGVSHPAVHRLDEASTAGAAWLSAYATVTAGQRVLLDNALLLSAVLAVGAATSLREIRTAAYAAVGEYRAADRELRNTNASRRFLEGMASRLSDLEAELAFSVDAATDPGAVLPYRPVESYHRTLVRALDLPGRALVVGRLLGRLAQGMAAEVVAVTSAEWRIEELRRAAWNGFAWVLVLIGIPAAIAIGYASRDGSYTDNEDVTAYIVAGMAAIVFVIAYAVVVSTVRRRARRRRRD